jgi:hypothetical protein
MYIKIQLELQKHCNILEKGKRNNVLRKGRPMNNIRMNRTKIPWTKSTKYLGVTLDEDLNFNEHIKKHRRKGKTNQELHVLNTK